MQDGKFAQEWVDEYKAGLPNTIASEEGRSIRIEETGGYLRDLMPWVPKRSIKGARLPPLKV